MSGFSNHCVHLPAMLLTWSSKEKMDALALVLLSVELKLKKCAFDALKTTPSDSPGIIKQLSSPPPMICNEGLFENATELEAVS